MRYLVINVDSEYAEFVTTRKQPAHSTYYVLEASSCCDSLDEAIKRVNIHADYELSMHTDPIILKHKTLKGVYGALGYWSEYYYGSDSTHKQNAPSLDKQYIINLIIEETSPWFNCAPSDDTPLGEILNDHSIHQIDKSVYDAYIKHVERILLNKNNYNKNSPGI